MVGKAVLHDVIRANASREQRAAKAPPIVGCAAGLINRARGLKDMVRGARGLGETAKGRVVFLGAAERGFAEDRQFGERGEVSHGASLYPVQMRGHGGRYDDGVGDLGWQIAGEIGGSLIC